MKKWLRATWLQTAREKQDLGQEVTNVTSIKSTNMAGSTSERQFP